MPLAPRSLGGQELRLQEAPVEIQLFCVIPNRARGSKIVGTMALRWSECHAASFAGKREELNCCSRSTRAQPEGVQHLPTQGKPEPADVELSPALDRPTPLVTTGAVPETVI
jgi:hypothetical protein